MFASRDLFNDADAPAQKEEKKEDSGVANLKQKLLAQRQQALQRQRTGELGLGSGMVSCVVFHFVSFCLECHSAECQWVNVNASVVS